MTKLARMVLEAAVMAALRRLADAVADASLILSIVDNRLTSWHKAKACNLT
jgi:hypothetical protein